MRPGVSPLLGGNQGLVGDAGVVAGELAEQRHRRTVGLNRGSQINLFLYQTAYPIAWPCRWQ